MIGSAFFVMLEQMAKCGINAQLLSEENSYRKAGIHVYLWETLRHLPQHPELTYSVLSTFQPDKPEQVLAPMRWNQTWRFTNHPIFRIIWEQLIWPLQNRLRRFDLIHGTAFSLPLFNRKPSVVTIFDLSFAHYPELFPRFRQFYLDRMTQFACRQATRIITISEASKQDIVRLYKIDPAKISVVYPGVRDLFTRPSTAQIERYRQQQNLPDHFIVHVGTLQPRKNLPLLIEAFNQAKLSPEIGLVFAGGKGWFFDEIFQMVKKMGLEDRVHFLGYVPDEDLPSLYAAADLLVFPSLYEGFGMPIVEAMSCGTPVISSDVSAMPEAVGEAGILFDPKDPSDLAQKLTDLFSNRDQLAALGQLGVHQAAHFNWTKAGQEIAEVYLNVLKGLPKKVS